MTGKISGLGVDLCVSFCRESSIAHIFRKARASPMRKRPILERIVELLLSFSVVSRFEILAP